MMRSEVFFASPTSVPQCFLDSDCRLDSGPLEIDG